MFKYLFSAFCCVAFFAHQTAAKDPDVLAFGIVDSLVEDISKGQREFLVKEFNTLVKDFTMLNSSVTLGGTPLDAGKNLESGKWHLGIFQGVEFARAQAKYPKLKPLMIATYKDPKIFALLITKKESTATGFGDFKGKNVARLSSREHCRLFADKGAQGKADEFFKMTTSRNVEEILDGVFQGKFDAAIVDNAGFKFYEEIQPGRFAKLKILAQSDLFPAAVLGYYEGIVSDKTLGQLREGMLKANKSESGKEIMANFRITTFDPVPADYQQALTNILKAYP